MSEQDPSPLYTAPEVLRVGELDVAYRRSGSGEPVLYLHGLRMTRRWLPFYEQLAQHSDLIVPEHPGCGDTPLPDWLESWDDLVIHYAELLGVLQWNDFHLVGYSSGGWLAAELAVFYPERLRSLTLITPMGLRVEGHRPIDLFRLSPQSFGEALFNGDAASYDDYLDEGGEGETLIRSYAELTSFAKVAWNPRYDRKLDRRLSRVECRATVVAAEDDRVVPGAHAERYAELLPNAQLEVLEGDAAPTGHGLVAQEPSKLAAIVAGTVNAEGVRS